MLDLTQKLRDATTFDELLGLIRDDSDLRQALIRALVEEHPEDVVSHISLAVGREKPTQFDVGSRSAS